MSYEQHLNRLCALDSATTKSATPYVWAGGEDSGGGEYYYTPDSLIEVFETGRPFHVSVNGESRYFDTAAEAVAFCDSKLG